MTEVRLPKLSLSKQNHNTHVLGVGLPDRISAELIDVNLLLLPDRREGFLLWLGVVDEYHSPFGDGQ